MNRTIATILYILLPLLALTSCGGAKLKTADEQMARGEYFDASKTYRKIYNKLKPREQRAERAEVAYKMAECHRQLGQDARAAAAYQNALRYGYPDSTILLRLAQSQHGQGQYALAVKSYEEYLAKYPGDALAERSLAGARKAADDKEEQDTLCGAQRHPVQLAPLGLRPDVQRRHTLFHHNQREGQGHQPQRDHRHETLGYLDGPQERAGRMAETRARRG